MRLEPALDAKVREQRDETRYLRADSEQPKGVRRHEMIDEKVEVLPEKARQIRQRQNDRDDRELLCDFVLAVGNGEM